MTKKDLQSSSTPTIRGMQGFRRKADEIMDTWEEAAQRLPSRLLKS